MIWRGKSRSSALAGCVAQQTAPVGVFWIDDITPLKANPDERLALARKYKPLPAAQENFLLAPVQLPAPPPGHAVGRSALHRAIPVCSCIFELVGPASPAVPLS